MPKIQSLRDELIPVLDNGACVGCGACAAYAPDTLEMMRNEHGAMIARFRDSKSAEVIPGGVCPFNSVAPDEDIHAENLFADLPKNSDFGRFRSLWAGHVEEGGFRARGSSGGITTWLLSEYLSLGIVDAVVHVHLASGEKPDNLFSYSISRQPTDVQLGAKTRYYSVSMDKVLAEIMQTGERIALVGVPCFIKAVRNLALKSDQLRERLVLALSLVCGHMKSASFAESLAWQAGVQPVELRAADFRVKIPGLTANNYGFSAKRKGGEEVIEPMASMAGRRWDGGYHRLKACDYCDDVFGETADASIGDAWLPRYINDDQGTNILVVRSKFIDEMIRKAVAEGRLALNSIGAEEVSAAQSGGLRDRREGLAYRLWLDGRANSWHPTRRIKPSKEGLTMVRRINYRLRRVVRDRSARSFRAAKKLGILCLYVWEMTFWHACFRGLSIVENRFFSDKRS